MGNAQSVVAFPRSGSAIRCTQRPEALGIKKNARWQRRYEPSASVR